MATARGVFDYQSNLTFASEPNAQMVVELRSPSKPKLDDPSLAPKIVSNIKSLGQLTEKALNTVHSPPIGPTHFHGAAWYGFAALALLLILITGLLAGLTLAVMSVDMTRLRVWTRTGSPKRQAQATAVLGLRQHPNWLLTSFILSSIAVGQALPMITNHLFTPGAMLPFVVSTVLLTLIGSLLPQAIMPLYTLMIASRMAWFITMLMWLTAPLSVPLGFAFRWCKILGKRKEEWKSDGILGRDELAEFVRLHQIDAGLGGKLGNKVGEFVRRIIIGEGGATGDISGWDRLFKVYEDQQVDAALLARLCPVLCPSMIVATSVHGDGEILGVVLRENFQAIKGMNDPVCIRDLPIHSVPIVRQNCDLMALMDWLLGDDERVAIVVNSHDTINCDANGLSWSPGGPYGDPPLGPVTSTPISPLGIITSHCFLRKLLLGLNDTCKPGQYTPTTWTERTDNHIGPSRSFSVPTHGSTPSTENFPAQGLRNRSNTLKYVSEENTKRFNSAPAPRSTLIRSSHPSTCGRFDGLDEIESVLPQPDPTGSLFSRLVSLLPSNSSASIRPVQLSPLANGITSNISPPVETSSSCYSSTNDETSLGFNLDQQVSETQSHTCDSRVFTYTEYSKRTSARRQSLPSRRSDKLDTSAAHWMSGGHAHLPIRDSEQIRGMRISSSRSTSTACGEIRSPRPSPLAMEQATLPVERVDQRYESLTDPADEGKGIQLPHAIQEKGSGKEELTRQADRRHESLTDPQEDVDVNDIIERVMWKSDVREDILKKPAINGEEKGAA
ncbi:hypothetical protein MMC27_005086 [Xylographa pallens]|nr:hypothetical protein [Xylographa pallens]